MAATKVDVCSSLRKKGRPTYQDNHLKERATSNGIKGRPGEGQGRAMEQNQAGEGQRSCFLRSLMPQQACIPDVAYPGFKASLAERIVGN